MSGLITFNNALNILQGDVTIRLANKDGTGRFQIEDSDTFPIFKVDSLGNLKTKKGVLQRI